MLHSVPSQFRSASLSRKHRHTREETPTNFEDAMESHHAKTAADGEEVPYFVHMDADADAESKRGASSRGATTGNWKTGIFGCFSQLVPNCAMVTFCPCVAVGQIAAKLEVLQNLSTKSKISAYWWGLVTSFIVVVAQYVLLALFFNQVAVIITSDSVVWGYVKYKYHHWGKDSTWYWFLIFSGVSYVLFSVIVWALRARARDRFQVRGNWFSDCWTSFWCPCCTLAQTASHIGSYTPGSCSFRPPKVDTLPAYT